MKQAILHKIQQRTCGRIRMLEVEVHADTVIVRGSARAYHIKQLALLGVRDVLGDSAGWRIELDIEVAASPTSDLAEVV